MIKIAGLIIKELWHRRTNFALATAAVTAAVAVCVALAMTHEGALRETRRVTRDIGFNLRIIPKQTDMDEFWLTGFSHQTMPEKQTIERLLSRQDVSYNHLVATLQQKYQLGGRDVILTGLSGEQAPPGRKKAPMSFAIEPGTLHVGYEVARRLNLQQGDPMQLASQSFKVARCMPETGSVDDVRVIGSLADIQRVLNLSDRINEVKAIDCLCLTADQNPLALLREELEQSLPEGRVVLLSAIADARAKQRQMTEKNASFSSALLLVVCAAWVGVMAVLNVLARTSEIGVLRALGYGSGTVATLILGRAVLVGVVGAIFGYAIGSWLAVSFGPEMFQLTAKAIRAEPRLLAWSLLAAPLFAALASFIPATLAVTQDPAVSLRRE